MVAGHRGASGTRLPRELRYRYLAYTDSTLNTNACTFKSVLPNLFSNLGTCRKYFLYSTVGLMEEAADGWKWPALGAALSWGCVGQCLPNA